MALSKRRLSWLKMGPLFRSANLCRLQAICHKRTRKNCTNDKNNHPPPTATAIVIALLRSSSERVGVRVFEMLAAESSQIDVALGAQRLQAEK